MNSILADRNKYRDCAKWLHNIIWLRGEFEIDSESGRVYCPWCRSWGGWDLENPEHRDDCTWLDFQKIAKKLDSR